MLRQREWRTEGFDDEIIDLCAQARMRLGETIADILKWSGANVPPLSLDCRAGSGKVQFKLYDRDDLVARMEEIETCRRRMADRPGGRPIGSRNDIVARMAIYAIMGLRAGYGSRIGLACCAYLWFNCA